MCFRVFLICFINKKKVVVCRGVSRGRTVFEVGQFLFDCFITFSRLCVGWIFFLKKWTLDIAWFIYSYKNISVMQLEIIKLKYFANFFLKFIVSKKPLPTT